MKEENLNPKCRRLTMVESNTTLDTRLKEQIVLLANDNAGNQEMYEANITIALLQINTHSSYGNFFNFYE